jgi:nitroreductase
MIKEASMDFDLAMTDALLTTTRSVRKRLDFQRPVPREVIMQCLQVATQAPNGSNRQEWRWLVIDDADLKRGLGELYRAAAEAYFAVVGAPHMDGWDEQTRRIFESWRWLVDHLAEAPVLVIPCTKAELPPNAPLDKMTAVLGSIYPAVWSFQLALRSRGLGSTLTTLHLSFAREAAALLRIPDGVTQVGLLPVAYTKGTDFKPAARAPAATVTHWNGW